MMAGNQIKPALLAAGLLAAHQACVVLLILRFFGAEETGIYAITQAYITPAVLLLNLQLRNLQASQRPSGRLLQRCLQTRMLTNLLLVLLVSVATLISSTTVDRLFIFLIVVIKIGDGYSDIAYGQLQALGRFDLIGWSIARRTFLSLGAGAAAVSAGYPVETLLASPALIWSACAAMDIRIARKNLGATFDHSLPAEHATISRIVREAMPMGFSGALNGLTTSIPRFIIQGSLGTESVGIFTAASIGPQMTRMVWGPIARSQLSHISSSFRTNWRSGVSATSKLVGGTTALAVVLISFAIGATYYLGSTGWAGDLPGGPHLIALLFVAELVLCPSTGLSSGIIASQHFKRDLLLRVSQILILIACFGAVLREGDLTSSGWAAIATSSVTLIAAIILFPWRAPRGRRR